MFRLFKPSDREIREFISRLSQSNYSYAELGATASVTPRAYSVDHNRIHLGSGAACWERAVKAIQSWEMFNLGWIRLCWPETPLLPGNNVAVLVRHFGFYSLNGARIVYTVDDDGPVKRFGFAYGTLREHAESGEERFTVEWNREDDSVWFDLLAFSRPSQFLACLAFPLARALQKRFAADSKLRMAFVVGEQRMIRSVRKRKEE